jgi:hypothetical protein
MNKNFGTIEQRTQEYVVVEVSESISRFDGKLLYTVSLLGLLDNREYTTYLQPTNINYKTRWRSIIESGHEGRVIRFDNFSLKEGDASLVNADSRPEAIFLGPLDILQQDLTTLFEHRANTTGNKVFDNLFEMERL